MTERPIAEFIVGTSPDGQREYVVRTQGPRFIARVFTDPTESMTDDEVQGDDAGQGIVINVDGDDTDLTIIEWIDERPNDDRVETLLRRAAAAFEEADLHAADMEEATARNQMTPDELRAAGTAIYGEHWQTPLARQLMVDKRLIRDWLSGKKEIAAERAYVIAGWAIRAMKDK